MNKALLLYPLGEIDKYEEITYTFNSAKTKTKLPALWLAEKIDGVEEITFIITKKLKEDYFSLFEKLCEFILKKEMRNVFSDNDIKKFRKRENFNEDKKIFTEKLKKEQESNLSYDFLIIDEENLLSFIHELKRYIESHADYTIHIDITHAYRFIPMFIVIVISLLKNAGKNIEIGEILYAFAGADENRIISLKDYLDVLNWSNVIYSFNNFANTLHIAQILKNYHSEISDLLHVLQQSLDMNLASKIKESISRLKDKFETMSIENEIFKQLVFDDLKKVLSEFVLDGYQSDFELSLARWHLKNRRYLHGYTALIEAFKSKICEIYGYNPDDSNQRKFINDIYNRQIKSEIAKKEEQIVIFLETLSKIRNIFVHLNVSQEENIYLKGVKFALTMNPSTIKEEINFSSIDNLLEYIEKNLTSIFPQEKVMELSKHYKKLNREV